MHIRLALGTILLALVGVDATAAVWHVDRVDDAPDANVGDALCVATTGGCTLRAAIQEANAQPGFDEVRVPGGAYFLTLRGATVDDDAVSGDLDIREPMWLHGMPDAMHVQIGDTFVLHAPDGERVFDIDTGNADVPVRFERIVVEFGKSHDALGGGGALVRAGSAAVFDRSTLYANGADRRGNALAVYGDAELAHTHVFDNHRAWDGFPGDGGGAVYLATNASLRLVDVAFDSNNHCNGGSVLADGPSTIDVLRSTMRGDRATELGGCTGSGVSRGDLFALHGAVNLSISDSTLGETGEAFFADGAAQIELKHVTIFGNSFFGAIALEGTAQMAIANSIVGRSAFGNGSCTAPAGAVSSLGGNVFLVSAPCGIAPHASDQVVATLALTPLALPFVGPGFSFEAREFYAPPAGSVAIDAGLATHCVAVDGTGSSRPVPGTPGAPARCDAGAVEWPPTHLHVDGFEVR